MFIYQKLASEIIDAIKKGILSPGDKLESVRAMAKKRQVGVSTATQVYRELERLGWIRAEAKRGYYVCPAPSSNPNQLSYGDDFVSARRFADLSLPAAVQYSFNDPAVLPLSCTAPSTVIDHELLLNKLHKKSLKHRPYRLRMVDPVEGLADLRGEIARHLLSDGQVVQKEQILITNGRNEALIAALQACGAMQGRVAVESPCSFYFQSILRQLNLLTLSIPLQSRFDDELQLLEQAYQAEPFVAYLVNPSFNDPTGRLLTVAQKRQLIAWAERRQVVLIEYDRSELYFGREKPASLVSLVADNSQCKVISIGDFFDTVSPTISMGYMICKNTVEQCLFAKQVTAEDPPITLQYMMFELLSSGQYRKTLSQLRKALSIQHGQMQTLLRAVLGDRVYISEPSGGPCLWLAMPPGFSSQAFWQEVIRHQIAIAPGGMFSSRDEFDHCFRITFGLPWDSCMESGVKTLAELLDNYLVCHGSGTSD